MLQIALFQPDIPQNVGAMMRLCACLNLNLNIIEPCGFPWDERKFRRTGLDYTQHAHYERHSSWDSFHSQKKDHRLILMTAHAEHDYTDFTFQKNDILVAGQESRGAPKYIHEQAYARVTIPMYGQMRSLNIVNATAMIAGEALRQIRQTEKET